MLSLRPLCFAILCSSCTVQLVGSDDTITIEGKVVAQGSPVAGATVSAITTVSNTVTTSSTGEYRLQVKPDKDRVKVNVEAKGYAPTIAVVTRRAGVFHYDVQVELIAPTRMEMPMSNDAGTQSMTVSAGGQDITIEVPPGVVPPGSMLEVTAFPAENGPGTMETTEGADRLLQTGGMLYVRVVDPSGNEVKALGGQGIGISPGGMTDIGEVGPTQGYALNEEAVWTPSTTSNATGKALRAQLAGFWNCDRNFRTSCIRGKLSAPGKSCAGQKVTAGGSNAMGLFSQDTSGGGGEFCVEGPASLSRTLSVGSNNKSISFPRTPGSCRTNPSACTDLGTVTVADADCPKSCGKDEVDSSSGCKPKDTGSGGGSGGSGGSGGGGVDSGGGFTCSTSKQCSTWNKGSQGLGCQWRACACVDAAGSCARGWYETNGGKVYACAQCSTSCTSAAQTLIAACK